MKMKSFWKFYTWLKIAGSLALEPVDLASISASALECPWATYSFLPRKMGMTLFLGTWGLERRSMGRLDECQVLVMLSVRGGCGGGFGGDVTICIVIKIFAFISPVEEHFTSA